MPEGIHNIADDPLFINPGSGGIGRNTLDGYMLMSDSPCLAKGKVISDNGGKDYWQNPVSSTDLPNIGAYNGSGKLSQPGINK